MTCRIGHRVERGDAETFGLLTVAPVLMALVTLIAFAGLGRAAQLAVVSAARECARVASAHMSPSTAAQVGRAAAIGSLIGSHLNVMQSSVYVFGHAGRGSEVTCTVHYRIPLAGLPLIGWFGLSEIDVDSTGIALVERYKSK